MSSATNGQRTQRKTQIGFVSSRSGDKSIKVTVAYKTPHPLYQKVVNRPTVLHVHAEKNETCTQLIPQGAEQALTVKYDKPSVAQDAPLTLTVPGVAGQAIEVLVP